MDEIVYYEKDNLDAFLAACVIKKINNKTVLMSIEKKTWSYDDNIVFGFCQYKEGENTQLYKAWEKYTDQPFPVFVQLFNDKIKNGLIVEIEEFCFKITVYTKYRSYEGVKLLDCNVFPEPQWDVIEILLEQIEKDTEFAVFSDIEDNFYAAMGTNTSVFPARVCEDMLIDHPYLDFVFAYHYSKPLQGLIFYVFFCDDKMCDLFSNFKIRKREYSFFVCDGKEGKRYPNIPTLFYEEKKYSQLFKFFSESSLIRDVDFLNKNTNFRKMIQQKFLIQN